MTALSEKKKDKALASGCQTQESSLCLQKEKKKGEGKEVCWGTFC